MRQPANKELYATGLLFIPGGSARRETHFPNHLCLRSSFSSLHCENVVDFQWRQPDTSNKLEPNA